MAKILIIEDETNLREIICEFFETLGHEVLQATDGLNGLELVFHDQPDLIISDVTMPKLDGYGFLEKLRSSQFSQIPVIIITANIDQQGHKKALLLGANKCITKPFALLELKKIAENYL